MPDFNAITVALVARFTAAAVTQPAGYDDVKLATADLPEGLTALPAILVFPSEGEFAPQGTGARRDSDSTFVVRFYYNQAGDLERDSAALRKWLTVLVGQLDGAVQLGGIVTSARVVTWRLDMLPYADQQYPGIELTVNVHVEEAVTVAA